MIYEFKMPDLGEGLAEAEVRKWLVQEGDQVEEHQSVLEVETDKAVVEVPSPKRGKILSLNHSPGQMIQVGEVLLTLEMEEVAQARKPSFGIVGELPDADDEPAATHGSAPREQTEEVALPGGKPPEPPAAATEILAMPAVRKLAREHGVDLSGIEGSGPQGSIRTEDIAPLISREPPLETRVPAVSESVDDERVPMRGLRRSIAKNLMRSKTLTAFVTTMEEVDMTELVQLKEREEAELAEKGIHLTFFPFFIKAVQHSLEEFPYLNASLDEEKQEILLKKNYHFGIAVNTVDGLMVPVVRDVGNKTIVQLAEELQHLFERAKSRTIAPEELKGSTFTLTNFGSFGGGFATPIINYPNVAILGSGRITDKPWVVGGEIQIRKIMGLSLTFDHRVIDGADAACFLNRIKRFLEDPGLLFIQSK